MPSTPDSAASRVFQNPGGMRAAFRAVGELLSADGHQVTLLIVGGASLNLLGMIERATSDVDVIARVHHGENGTPRVANADPFPEVLRRAIATVARDMRLPGNWMNHEVAKQWRVGFQRESSMVSHGNRTVDSR
jgi:hypothetical protein